MVVIMAKKIKGYQDLPPMTMTIESTDDIKTGAWRTFKPIMDKEKCNACYICWRYCPEPCIIIKAEGDPPEFDYDFCKGCGICAHECPKDAIELILEVIE
jgi:2-oxoacid:acceptor oxidoreductase delta subunit (pyruvate/2-ketoisovalerate family)